MRCLGSSRQRSRTSKPFSGLGAKADGSGGTHVGLWVVRIKFGKYNGAFDLKVEGHGISALVSEMSNTVRSVLWVL